MATVIRFELPPGAAADDVAAAVARVDAAARLAPDGAGVEITTERPTPVVHAVTGWAVGRGAEQSGLTVARPTLEDTFLRLVADGEGGGT